MDETPNTLLYGPNSLYTKLYTMLYQRGLFENQADAVMQRVV